MDINEIFKFVSPIFVGFLSAYLGSRLALSKFKKEKLWDERRVIYREVIDAFEELHHWSEYVRANHGGEPTIEQETSFDLSLRQISKYSLSGSLYLSEEFHKKLQVANSQLYSVRFDVNEESRPDSHDERAQAEWLFVLAVKIRKVIEANLPLLIEQASRELPK